MAYPLNSPGVDVEVTDESIYASNGTGTTPLFIVGSHSYKTQPDGSTLASGTIPDNANTLYTITSQRNLCQTFGNPVFYTIEGTPQDGYELNEYGLHAAYQYLAISNTAYVIRGALDYSQLRPTTSSPRGQPIGGTFWLNTVTSKWGIYQSNGNANLSAAWVLQSPLILTESSDQQYMIIGSYTAGSGVTDPTSTSPAIITTGGNLVINSVSINLPSGTPLVGTNGSQGVVDLINAATSDNTAYVIGIGGKAYLMLVDVGNVGKIDLEASDTQVLLDLGLTYDALVNNEPVIIAATIYPALSLGSSGSYAVNTIYNDNAIYQKLTSYYQIASSNVVSMPVWYQVGTTLWNSASENDNTVTFAPSYQIPSGSVNGDVWINTSSANNGVNIVVETYNATTGTWTTIPAPLYLSGTAAIAGIGSASLTLNASVYVQYPDTNPANATIVDPANSNNTIPNPNYIRNTGAYFTPYIWSGSDWSLLNYQAQGDAPTSEPEDGTLWFNNDFQVDIMVSTGQKWVGYQNFTGYANTDPNGPILDASAPSTQSDGTPLVDNDLWVNTSLATLESYPQIYRFTASTRTWQLINNADNVTPNGIIFQDARWNVDGSENGSQASSSFIQSDFVDPDAPDPLLYPSGLLLFNTRFSTMNVKEWQSTQLTSLYNGTDYTQNSYTSGISSFAAVSFGGRWVTASGNAEDGTPYMGRKAQRALIIQSLRASLQDNDNLLSETFYFNLIACPGYPELLSDMNTLNTSKKQVAFVVGDTPARLNPSGTSLVNWATNTAGAVEDGDDGLVTASPYISIYYPWGVTTNVDGTTIVVPPSTMAMSTIAYSDSVSYVWYTPAGYTRGLVSNATSVGYINSTTGLYQTVLLNQGQRDVLYENNICAIAYMPNRGLVIMGDKTLDSITNAENRINVARLVCYLRYQLDVISRPFLFEPNVQHTRDSVKTVMDRFLSNLITLNALYDYIVVCDTTNNTPDTIDNNELWIDIAIQPVKTIDFIYIPLRIETTGTDLSTVFAGTSGTSTS